MIPTQKGTLTKVGNFMKKISFCILALITIPSLVFAANLESNISASSSVDQTLTYTPTMQRELKCIKRLEYMHMTKGIVTHPFINFQYKSAEGIYTFVLSPVPRLGYYMIVTKKSESSNSSRVSFYPITNQSHHGFGDEFHLKMKLSSGSAFNYMVLTGVDIVDYGDNLNGFQQYFYDKIDEVKGAGSMTQLTKYIHKDLLNRIAQVNDGYRSDYAMDAQNIYMYLDTLKNCRQDLNSQDREVQKAIILEIKKFEDRDLQP